jgi:hypothetical protein
MSRITSNTLISLPVIAALIGGLLWLTDVSATGKLNRQKLTSQDRVMSKIDDKLDEVIQRLSRIEGKMEQGK